VTKFCIDLNEVRVGLPAQFSLRRDESPWVSTIVRRATTSGQLYVTHTGLAGDQCSDARPQRPDELGDNQMHGGPFKALYAYPWEEHLPWWRDRIGEAGLVGRTFGEQLRITGINEHEVHEGDVWYWGDEVVLEVTKPRIPCNTLVRHFGDLPMISIMQHSDGRCGWYLKVRHGGYAPTYCRITVEPNLQGRTIAEMFAARMNVPVA